MWFGFLLGTGMECTPFPKVAGPSSLRLAAVRLRTSPQSRPQPARQIARILSTHGQSGHPERRLPRARLDLAGTVHREKDSQRHPGRALVAIDETVPVDERLREERGLFDHVDPGVVGVVL